jgi:hypothetical protein
MGMSFLRCLPILALALAGCSSSLNDNSTGSTGDGTGSTKDANRTVQDATGMSIVWPENSDYAKSGRIAGQGGTALSITAYGYPGNANETYFPSCFDNNRNCRRAHADVQATVLNNPVAIQAFRLNLSYADRSGEGAALNDAVTVEAASVTTAELQFSASTGAMVLGTANTKQLVAGKTCDLTNANAVGYANTSGTPKILVGLLLLEEATKSPSIANSYFDGVLSAGRVWHSGLYPDGSSTDSTKPFRFRFEPVAEAAYADFGLNPFTESPAAGDTVLTEKFGLSAADGVARWQNHVITGWCLQGTKTKAGVARPLLWGAYSYLSAPKLQKN